ncbi:MAG: FG-GAP-like repeat-containing protein [Pirellulaceae bacterium]|nr:FG-GAP-like repeat-containing protein [Pirellulaceae bacterium]
MDASENTLSDNVISGNEMDGVLIRGVTARVNAVTGNLIGLNADGNAAVSNQGAGVYIDGAPANAIGADTPESGNVISGNAREGVKIVGPLARGNEVLNNYIGTDHDGHGAGLGNALGVLIENAAENRVGALDLGHNMGNVIAGNYGDGVLIRNTQKTFLPDAVDNKIQVNWIGLDADQAPLPNRGAGVRIVNAAGTIVGSEPIGATGEIPDDNAGNIIAHNHSDGVRVEGPYTQGNSIRGNSIYANEQLGINLVGGREVVRKPIDGVTPNDDDDSDDGPNRLMNFPVGVTAVYDPRNDTTYISGVLAAAHPDQAMVDVYANAARDASGFGEGQLYVGSATPNPSGVFHLTRSGKLPAPYLSAAATDGGGRGSTSEFSPVCDIDSDGDGLPDDWEKKGIDFNGDGRVDLDLPKLGARPDHRDLFVEFDYLEGFAPSDMSITLVQSAFHHAPVPNPDGTSGIDLHVNRVSDADRIPFVAGQTEKTRVTGTGPGASDDWWDLQRQYYGTAAERAQADQWPSIRGARGLVFRHCIFLRDLFESSGSSGYGKIHGDSFIVSLGSWDVSYLNRYGGRAVVEAGTFMHELGHTLGLHHGGPVPAGYVGDVPYGDTQTNYKPNYLSVMNYSFQDMRYTVRPLDYSTVQLPSLDESKLLERDGINGQSWYPQLDRWTHTVYTDIWTGTSYFHKVPSQQGIDWNRSLGPLDTGHVGGYINDPSAAAAHQDTLDSYRDWPSLRYSFRYSKTGFRGLAGATEIPSPPPGLFHAEPTDQEIFDTLLRADSDEDGVVNAYDNVPQVPNPDQTDSDGNGIGDAGELLSVVLDRNSVAAGQNVTGTITALVPAPAGGLRVFLWTSDAGIVEAPESVIIPAGQRSATFTLRTLPELATSATVDVYAHYWGEALHTQLLVGPPLPQADLEIEQTAAPVPVGVGGDLTYSITVTNHGPTAATGVTITDLLPANADLVSVTAMRTLPPPANEPLHVRFDYSFDWSGFFDTDEKKALLDLAADLVLADIRDNLRPIRPSGTNTWTAIFTHPTTGEEVEYPDLTIEANELVVFVGARDLGYTLSGMLEGGEGVIGGSSADGTAEFVRTVSTRGERAAPYDVAPWGGSIAFTTDPSVTFHYGVDTVDLDPDELDFLTVAVHELYHVLGFGTSPAWDSHIEWDTDLWDRAFVGSQARQEYDAGGPVPLDPGRQHWREGTTDQGAAALMDPYIERGRRELPTRLDAAALADLGWGDAPCSTQVPLPYTYAAGTVVFDADGLAPGESLTLQIVVMPTVEGSVTNQLSVAGDGTDPDSSNNTSTLTTDVLPCPPLVVNTTRDLDDRISDGRLTSLREAIRLANLLPGRDFISFEIPDFGSVSYISVYSPLPTITDPVVIDGTTQPGFVDAPVINLGAPFRQGGFNGLHITAGNSEVRGLWISGFGYQTLDLPRTILRGNGILLEDGGGNIIEGNYLGAATAYSLGNETAGIMLINSDGNRIGGTTPESRNVIAGNYNWGILAYDSHHNIIEGNYIGTDPSGQLPAGNGVGLSLSVADDNQIGGTQPGAGNVISGNRGVGIEVSQNYLFTNASRTRIEGNWIGTAADGTGSLGNGSHGIAIWLGNHDNVIGGRDLAAANTIAFNGGAGVLYGSSNTNTLILGNSIHSNAGLAIDRWPIGVDANSQYYWFYPSPDYPELAYAVSDTAATRIRGTMKGLPNTSCQLDFYFSASADPSGHGEGQQWLGLATVTTDAYGIAPFYVSFPQGVPAGHFIAATSTVTETSEFSNSVPVRADRDGDGVPDAEENGGPNLGDADHDGNPDSDEANVATFLVFGGGQHLTLQSPPATQLSGICSIANPAPGSSPYATPFPLGFIDGTIEDVPPGGAVTVTLLLPAAFEPHGFYQFGMLAGASENNWYEFLDDGVTGAEVFADRIVLHYVDGGRGDHDLAADGRIMFRGGVSAPAAMYVLEVSPAANENTVSAATSISATFASQVDPATVSDLTFVVHASQSGQLVVPPSALTVDRATVTFDGAPLFHPGELVNVTATRGIENTSGESPPSPFAWQFRAAALGGTGVFAESDQRFGIPDTYGVAMQDLDGDGDIDIFFANGAPEPSTVMLNDGHGVFADSGQQLGPFDARDVALGDVDGDGDLDAFLATLQGGNHVWLNDGHAVFTDSGQQLGTAGTWGVRLGDLDGDGDLDAFCATEAGQPNNVWINDGQGRFADSGQRLGAADSRDVALGDVDHDGDLDAFVANFDGGNQVWVNNGQGVFADSDQRLGAPGNRAVALGDLDGDGDLDAYTASAGWDTVWFNDGQGRFTASNQYLQSDGMTIDLDDFDADGDLDALALTHSASGYGDLWLNDGFGRFQASGRGAQFIGAATTTGGQALGDVDGDGDADAVLANLTPGWFGRTMLLINEGAGVIGWSNATSNYLGHSGQELWSTSMADLDRDGDLDIFFGGSAEEASLVWFNDGQGRFIPGGPRPGRPDLSQLKANLGDLDGDGDLDAVVWYVGGFGYPTYWNVWLNDGHGRFADSGQERVLVREQHRITLGDVDGDGDLDAIVVGGGWHTTSNEIWLNDGLGNFTKTSAVLGTALDGTKDIALGDIDGDGDLDAFLANSETAIIDDSRNTIWLNDGQGNFSDSGQRLGHTHDACDRVRLADMDEDGDLDAVVATIVFQWNHWQGWIPAIHRYEVWLNDGQGHFSDSGQRLAAGPVGEYLVNPFELADLDGDGDLDVFSGDRVWLNDGRARFSDSGQALGDWVHLWFRPYWPRDVSVGDADGDGDLDAVVLYQHRPALWLNQDPDQINYSPNAAADGFSVPQGTVLDVPSPGVLANDVDPEDEPLTAELVVAPLYAMHFELHDDGSFTYTPHPDYFGPDRFEYAAVDPLGHASRAVVSIFLLPGRAAPVAEDDVVTTQQERAVTVNVLANDRDRSGPLDPQTIVLLSAPANGRATLDLQTGMVAYEPQQDFVGSDSFTYRITGATGLRDDATVTIHVLAGPRPPRAAPDAAKTDEDTPVVVDVVTNDIDPDGDLDRTTVVIVVSPTHGLVQVDASSGTVTYTPSADFFGTDRFVYTVSDRQSASSRAVVDISVLPRDDAPQAADDFAHTDQDVPVVIDVLANDADADGDLDVRSVSVVELPLHGATEVDPDTGAITYSPAAGFRGLDSCVYEVRDAAGQAATATVRIEVRPTSHPPRATADAAETPEDTPVTIDVAANDTDPDGDLDPGSVRILVQPLHGGAVVVPETGQIVFTPPADGCGADPTRHAHRRACADQRQGLRFAARSCFAAHRYRTCFGDRRPAAGRQRALHAQGRFHRDGYFPLCHRGRRWGALKRGHGHAHRPGGARDADRRPRVRRSGRHGAQPRRTGRRRRGNLPVGWPGPAAGHRAHTSGRSRDAGRRNGLVPLPGSADRHIHRRAETHDRLVPELPARNRPRTGRPAGATRDARGDAVAAGRARRAGFRCLPVGRSRPGQRRRPRVCGCEQQRPL